MRDLTKSINSFTWAISLFGLEQMVNVLRPGKAAASMDAVTDAAERQLGDVMKSTFRAGDNLQRGMVDMAMGMFSPEMLDPTRWAKMASETVSQATGQTTGRSVPS